MMSTMNPTRLLLASEAVGASATAADPTLLHPIKAGRVLYLQEQAQPSHVTVHL